MIEKPAIEDKRIIHALNENYSVQVSKLEFLPIGNDASAFSYRVETRDGNLYFLKIKTKPPDPAGLLVPRFLRDKGMKQVVAPLYTKTQKLSGELDGFCLVLYPFIVGSEAMQVGMTHSQWTEFGSALKRIHTTDVTEDISQFVQRESFIPKWSQLVKALHNQVHTQKYDDPYQKQFALVWKEKEEVIQTVIERTEWIERQLQQVDQQFFLCHADIHTANLLITPGQELFIVDWDDTLFAPKERDLMFVLNEVVDPGREEQFFFNGYGDVTINSLALAYYRYEWCVQEIGDFGKRVFLMKDIGETTKQHAVEGFRQLFSEGDVIEAAFHTSFEAEIRKDP